MKIFRKLSTSLCAFAFCASAIGFTACSSSDDFDTNQYASSGVHLNVFGPSPVARGGELRFLGTGMDQINSVEIPGCDPITDIKIISNEEIRVTVPQSAQVGKLTLTYPEGSITTKTQISYTEPISIESFAPTTIKPGNELTIKGEYLNLIGEVIFPEDVVVDKADFTAHSRNEIKLIVPAEAQTGKFIISDAAPTIPNWIYSDEELVVVLPSVEAPLDLSKAKPGDVITVSGKDFDLITKVLMPNGDEVEFTYAEGQIKFTLPENISDGAIVAVPASGVKVAIANIGVVVPTELEAVPSIGLRPGQELIIKGVNMQMVSSLSFVNVAEPVAPASVTGTEVRVAWPEMAHSGAVTLNLKSGKSVEVEVETAKPEVQAFNPNPVAAASSFTMRGKNLDLIKFVTFAGNIKVEVTPDNATRFTMTAPATAKSGELTLTMANGETVTTPALTIDTPQCAFITETVTEEPRGGELLVVKGENLDKLTEVQVNGQSVQFIVNGENLYILLPQASGNGTVVTLISSNGQISYTYDVIPATHVENAIWSGAWENAAWSGLEDLSWGRFDWSTIPADATLTLYMTPTVAAGEWWCVSLRHGDGWANLPGGVGSQIDMPADGIASITLTREILDDLIKNGGLIITGQGYILTKVTVSWEISLAVTLWEGELIADDWANQPYALTDAGPELADAGAKAGQTVYFYLTPIESEWKLEILEGHWGPSYGAWCAPGSDTENGKFIEWDLAANKGRVGLVLTQDMLNAAYTQQWWGGVFVLNGDNVKCTKIVLE